VDFHARIFIPLLDNFGVDPLFFGLLVALNPSNGLF
jgi:TRAP-type C4-dicarboxylate transport system permease large subunit